MLPLWILSVAFAQTTVVAVGDVPDLSATAPVSDGAPVLREAEVAREAPLRAEAAVPKPRTGGPAVAGGWVAVLADCLEERAPARWSVVDRGSLGDSPRAVADRLNALGELKPQVVVLGVGTQEATRAEIQVDVFQSEVRRMISSLRQLQPAPGVLLLGIVPPTGEQLPDAPTQELLDQRAEGLNAALGALSGEGVVHLNLQEDWPSGASARRTLTVDGWRLSDQGHARVAAAVCDSILTRFPSP